MSPRLLLESLKSTSVGAGVQVVQPSGVSPGPPHLAYSGTSPPTRRGTLSPLPCPVEDEDARATGVALSARKR